MIKLTILSENTVTRPGLLAEHGFACWIETDSGHFLFDTGQGFVLKHNADALDIDLSQADGIILSHGHYDHTGALPELLALAPNASVYAHPDFAQAKYSRKRDVPMHAIGAPQMTIPKERFVSTIGHTTQPGGLFITGEIPRITEFEDVGGSFYLDEKGDREDLLLDDQAMFFHTQEGVVILLGCAHSGVVNTIMHVCELAKTSKIHGVIGGMHLCNADDERIAETVRYLQTMNVSLLAPVHCTGFSAVAKLHTQLPDAFHECTVGSSFTFNQGRRP